MKHTTTRGVIAQALAEMLYTSPMPGDCQHEADAVLAALAAAGKEVIDVESEWGVRWDDGEISDEPYPDRFSARHAAEQMGPAVVVRRRPAGKWEVTNV